MRSENVLSSSHEIVCFWSDNLSSLSRDVPVFSVPHVIQASLSAFDWQFSNEVFCFQSFVERRVKCTEKFHLWQLFCYVKRSQQVRMVLLCDLFETSCNIAMGWDCFCCKFWNFALFKGSRTNIGRWTLWIFFEAWAVRQIFLFSVVQVFIRFSCKYFIESHTEWSTYVCRHVHALKLFSDGDTFWRNEDILKISLTFSTSCWCFNCVVFKL